MIFTTLNTLKPIRPSSANPKTPLPRNVTQPYADLNLRLSTASFIISNYNKSEMSHGERIAFVDTIQARPVISSRNVRKRTIKVQD